MSAGAEGRRVIVLGGTSEIALAIVRELQARAPREVVLAGRVPGTLASAAEDLRAGGCARVATLALDALDTAHHGDVLARAFRELGGADIVILAVGVLGERGALPAAPATDLPLDPSATFQVDPDPSLDPSLDPSSILPATSLTDPPATAPATLPADVAGAVHTMQVDFTGSGSLLIHAALRLREQGTGAIVVLSSVAAERPRRANAVYGASKAGLDALAQAIGDELHERGVHVLVVRPGFVRTRMTRGLAPAPLATTAPAVARVVVAGLDRGARVVWAPRALRWPMLVIRMLPRSIFRRIKQ